MLDRNLRDRYSRQTMFPGIGEEGQVRLGKATAVIIGCGALGCNSAVLLARAGVGKIKIIDRDFPEYHNLQRQPLFDEADVKTRLPKAVAAELHLKEANSTNEIRGIVADVNCTNIEKFCQGADVILDGLDNAETRLLINDFAMKHRLPWVYGSAVASAGMAMTIVPGKTPCYRCIRPVVPEPGSVPTCETAGVVGTAPAIVGALQASEAIKLIVGAEITRGIIVVDVWKGTFETIKIKRREDCPTCRGEYEFLDARFTVKTTSFCGQSRAIQVVDARTTEIDLVRLAGRLDSVTSRDSHSLRFTAGGHEMIVFPDGRAIIKGTIDEALAIELYAKYVAPFAD